MNNTMRALVKEKPEQGFKLKNVPIPDDLAPNEALIKISKASICGTDLHIYEWNEWAQQNIKPPQIAGHEFTGEVIKTGTNVSLISKGDIVTSETHIPCRKCLQCKTGRMHICKNLEILGVHRDGAFAEYIKVPEIVLWKLPKDFPEKYASIMEPFGNAIHTCFVENLAGKNVLITGAGPIGCMAASISKAAGAAKVIVTEIKDYRKELAWKSGSDYVLDPTDVNIPDSVKELTDKNGADILLEMSGNETAFIEGLKSLTNGGTASVLGVFPGKISFDINSLVIFKGIKLYGITGRKMFETWQTATELIKNNRVDLSSVVTHELKLEEWEEGIENMLKGKAGKVVLDIE
ncbi:MAG: L-threonine 3-dehydrogenase [Kosmotogaceae bacterium]